MPTRADVPLTVTDEAELEALRARVAELETSFDEAVQAAKLQALYNFAYGISHMINNPLANIATRAQTLLREEADPERRKKLATINQQAFRAHEMIADLMHFARPPRLQLQTVDLAELAAGVVSSMQSLAEQQGTQLSLAPAPERLIIQADPAQLSAAIKAIVQNALEAVRSGGAVTLNCHRTAAESRKSKVESREAGAVPAPHFSNSQSATSNPQSAIRDPQFCISITDTGPGISPESLPHLFDPYYSGREAGRGLGLGLSKAWRIVEQHAGRIEVDSPSSGGARFSIVLPA